MTKEQFRQMREELGLTQVSMAEQMGYNRSDVISNKENGHRGITRQDILIIEKLWPEYITKFKLKTQ